MLDQIIDNALMESAPPPLDPLENAIISDHNLKILNERQRALKRLPFIVRLIYGFILPFKRWQLAMSGYNELIAERKRLKPIMARLRHIQRSRTRSKAMMAYWEQNHTCIERWNQLDSQLRKRSRLADRVTWMERELADHRAWTRDRIKQKKTESIQRKEARIYEQIIIDRLTSLRIAYHYDDGKKKVDKVKFSHVGMSLDRIWFQLDTSYRTMFGNWKTNIPYGVSVSGQILTPETLDELSIACRRQVTGYQSNLSGAWLVVNRLDSHDGLINYIRYTDLLAKYDEAIREIFPVYLGVTFNRELVRVSLEAHPHWLIAGYTNTGKSNMINVGICQLITKHTPKELRMVLIDLKGGLEFGYFEQLPHLHRPIAQDVEEVLETVRELVGIMEMRFKQMKGKAKKYEHYRLRYPDEEFPRVLCVFDEVASLDTNSAMKKEILQHLALLTQKGRAVGIHIWMCTQRPDIKVIEGAVKVNLSCRISFRMATSSDSVTILGNSVAKDLPDIQGRAVIQLGPSPEIMQSAHITDVNVMDSIKEAMKMEPGTPILLPEDYQVVHQEWTIERIIRHSLTHMQPPGILSARRIRDDIGDNNLSHAQCRVLVEKIWDMGRVEFEGEIYEVVTQRGNRKVLVKVEGAKVQRFDTPSSRASLPEPATESSIDSQLDSEVNEQDERESVDSDTEEAPGHRSNGKAPDQVGHRTENGVETDDPISRALARRFGTAGIDSHRTGTGAELEPVPVHLQSFREREQSLQRIEDEG